MTVGNIRGLGRRLKEGLDAMEIWVIKNMLMSFLIKIT